MNVLPKTEEGRFWEKVEVGGASACWPWSACVVRGYGHFKSGGRMVYAHRWAYESFHGPLPPDACGLKRVRELDHLCRNTLCVNPGHLELVTHLENIRRGDTGKHNARKTHCKRGHEFTEENTQRRPDGKRHCRACRAAATRASRRRVASQGTLEPV